MEVAWVPGDRAWLPDAENVWLPAILDSISGGKATFRLGSSSTGLADLTDAKTTVVDEARLSQLDQVADEQLEGVGDITSLSSVGQAAMLHTFRVRYFKRLIYTRVGRILIVVNPFTPLPIYSTEYVDQYRSIVDSTSLPPHIYGLGHDTLRGMRLGSVQNHVVLISGESGAGKTESSKLILSFVAESVASESKDNIEEKILQTSPIFEAFGNATTVRNSNSSRFGKWLDLRFSKSMQVLGCELSQYLLETTRVCRQAPQERCYHIFFQMLRGLTEGCDSPRLPTLRQRRELHLKKPEDYRYLRGSVQHVPGIDDLKRFEDTLDAFASVGFDLEAQFEVFKVLSGVLMLGNCDFVPDGDGARLADSAPCQTAAELLGVDANKLSACMLVRTIVVGSEVLQKPLQVDQAQYTRDSLARLLYDNLFKWLVSRMNQALNAGSEPSASEKRLGVLDIAGFEFFEHNSLEQLLINLSNEHLQQSFNQTIFTGELEEISKEGIDLGSEMTFADNSDCLALITGKGGILDLLDESVALPKATDATFAANVVKVHAKHPRLVSPKYPRPVFGVRHFAGEVTYSCEGLLDKNANKPPDGSVELMSGSSLHLLRQWAESDEGAAAHSSVTSRGKARKAPTIASSFRASMKALIGKISDAERHYIRCIKPNKEKVPGKFDAPMAMEQLNFSGILEAVRIRRIGFSSRLPFMTFMSRYGRLVNSLRDSNRIEVMDRMPSEQDERIQRITGLVRALSEKFAGAYAPDQVRVGHTKVLMKSEAVAVLDRARAGNLHGCAIALQAAARARRARERHRIFKEIEAQMRQWLHRVDASSVKRESNPLPPLPPGSLTSRLESREVAEETIKQGVMLLEDAVQKDFKNKTVQQTELVLVRLRQELDVLLELQSLLDSTDPVAVERVLARADALGLGGAPAHQELAKRLEHLLVQLPLDKAQALGIDVSAEPPEIVQPEPDGKEEATADAVVATSEAGESASSPSIQDQGAMVEDLPLAQRRKTRKSVRRKTVTGLSVQGQENILEHLQQAVEEYNVEELEKYLGEACVNGLEKQDLENARQVFHQLQDEVFIKKALEELAEVPAQSTNPFDASEPSDATNPFSTEAELDQKRSLNLKTQLAKLQKCDAIDTGDLGSERKSTVDEAELEGTDKISALLHYPGLKHARLWKGHRKSYALWTPESMVRRPTVGADIAKRNLMLHHSKDTIAEALTQKVPANEEEKAVQNFRNILYYMADKPAQELVRQASFDYIISLAMRTEFCDEVFCQVVKQLTGNPSQRSAHLGWQLLLLLCQSVLPSQDLFPFIKKFLEGFDTEDADAEKERATSCLQAMEMRMLPVLRGHLWKKKPGRAHLRPYEKRYFVLGNHQLFWWEKQEDFLRPESARPRGGPLCRGVIDFIAEDCEMDALGGFNGTQFCLRPHRGHWSRHFEHTAGDPKRVFTFETKGLEHDREVWMSAINHHMEYANRFRVERSALSFDQTFAGRTWATNAQTWATDSRE